MLQIARNLVATFRTLQSRTLVRMATHFLSLLSLDSSMLARQSSVTLSSCKGAIASVTMWVVLVLIQLNFWATSESGNIFLQSDVKWSATVKARLCSAMNLVNNTSALVTLSCGVFWGGEHCCHFWCWCWTSLQFSMCLSNQVLTDITHPSMCDAECRVAKLAKGKCISASSDNVTVSTGPWLVELAVIMFRFWRGVLIRRSFTFKHYDVVYNRLCWI